MNGADLLTERLLRVVDEGRRTATYKLALLLALIDAAAPAAGSVRTRDLAALVLEVYYPQSRAYAANDGIARELRQISMKASSPLRAVLRLRLHAEAAGCRTMGRSGAALSVNTSAPWTGWRTPSSAIPSRSCRWSAPG